jgi:hypothetical protein
MIAALLASLALGCPAPVFADDGAQISAVGHDWFVCSGGASRRFYTDFPGVKLSAFQRFGHRIAFAIDFPNESHTAGYVDERTGVMEIASAPQRSTLLAFTLDAAGGVIQLSRLADGTSQITYAPSEGTRLLAPVVLARGDVDPASLAVSGETVTWSGGSAPLPVFGCGSGETRYAAGATRIFAADAQVTLYFCSAAVRTPKRLSLEPHTFGDELHVFGASGPRLLLADMWMDYFITGWDAAWIDLRNGAYHAAGANFGEIGSQSGPLPFGPIDGMAVSSDGAIALLERPAGRHRQLIAYARFGGGRLGRLRALARIPAGDVVASSLRLARGKVTWRTSSGRRSAVPTRARG